MESYIKFFYIAVFLLLKEFKSTPLLYTKDTTTLVEDRGFTTSSISLTGPFVPKSNPSNTSLLSNVDSGRLCYFLDETETKTTGWMQVKHNRWIQLTYADLPSSYSIKLVVGLVKQAAPAWPTGVNGDYIAIQLDTTNLVNEYFVFADSFVDCYDQPGGEGSTQVLKETIYIKQKTFFIDSSTIADPNNFGITIFPMLTSGSVWGLYCYQLSYLPCHQDCKTCVEQYNDNCTSCATPKYLSGNECIEKCPSGEWRNPITLACQACPATNCDECEPLITICFSCKQNFFMVENGNCIFPCEIGKYGDIASSKCLVCATPCVTCVDPGTAEKCTSCPEGFVTTDPVLGSTCDACHESCLNCIDFTATTCVGCADGFYQQILDAADCKATCLPGEWGQNGLNICIVCHSYCILCEDDTTTRCTGCNSPSFQVSTTICTNLCPDGTYGKTSPRQCDACTSTCLTCRGSPTVCLTCVTGKYLLSSACSSCAVSCDGCIGAGDSNCIYCSVGYYMILGTCYLTCPANYWPDTTHHVCGDCHPFCDGCTGGYNTECILCQIGYYLTDTTCLQCDASCITCTGGANTECQSCINWYYLYGTTCDTTCPSEKFPDSDGNICTDCDPSCLTCDEANSWDCLTCLDTQYLFAQQCLNCHASCVKCVTSSINCIECSPLYFKHTNNLCLGSCPLSYYADVTTQTCQPCYVKCQTCNGLQQNNCLICNYPYKLDFGYCKTCSDYVGYQTDPTNATNCLEICGDGLKILSTTKCDDGNNLSGDGCSSACLIEDNFNCQGGSSSAPDVCIPIKIHYTIQLQHDKTKYDNILKNELIYFSITLIPKPIYPNGKTLSDYISISIEGVSISDYSYNIYQSNDRRNLATSNIESLVISIEVRKTLRSRDIIIALQDVPHDGQTTSLKNSADSSQSKFHIESYQYYDQTKRIESQQYANNLSIEMYFFIGIVVILLFSNSFNVAAQGIDQVQNLYMMKFSGTTYSLSLLQFFEQLKPSFEFYLPNPFSATYYINQTIFTSHLYSGIDALFLVNAGPIILAIIVLILIYLVVKILSSDNVCKCKNVESRRIQRICQRAILQFFEYTYFSNIALTLSNVIFFYSILQLMETGGHQIVIVSDIVLGLLGIAFLLLSYYFCLVSVKNRNNLYMDQPQKKIELRFQNKLFKYRSVWASLDIERQGAFLLVLFQYLRKLLFPLILVLFRDDNQLRIQLLIGIPGLSILLQILTRGVRSQLGLNFYFIIQEILTIVSLVPFLYLSDDSEDPTLRDYYSQMFILLTIVIIGLNIAYNVIFVVIANITTSMYKVIPLNIPKEGYNGNSNALPPTNNELDVVKDDKLKIIEQSQQPNKFQLVHRKIKRIQVFFLLCFQKHYYAKEKDSDDREKQVSDVD